MDLSHQRTGRAHGDAVAAVDAGRIGKCGIELGRYLGGEPTAGDGDGERVLVLFAAGVDTPVTEDAGRVIPHVEIVFDLDRFARRCGEALGRGRVVASMVVHRPFGWIYSEAGSVSAPSASDC